jgi:hypothetical protein
MKKIMLQVFKKLFIGKIFSLAVFKNNIEGLAYILKD